VTLAALWSWLPRLTNQPLRAILMYHRVAEPPADPWALCVSPANFAEQMAVLRTIATPVRLADLCTMEPDGPLVAVTFDDGYADNLYAARPILERYDVPATVFVSTDHIGNADGFWWDRLEHIFLHPGRLPPGRLEVRIGGKRVHCQIDSAELCFTPEDCQRYAGWVAWRQPPPTSRHATFYRLWDRLRNLAAEERESKLNLLAQWAGQPVRETRAACMSESELVRLFDSDLVEPGDHAASHTRLSALPPCEQLREVTDSRNRLQTLLSAPVRSFSYPFGGRRDYTRETVAIVQRAGFERACVNVPGIVNARTRPFEMPRLHAENQGGESFKKWLLKQR
jgi:peptidoglycan/xylan/chitin deacetylase (PgdA/CDA1 family)